MVSDKPQSPLLQQSTDAIVRMHKATICGTDLHIHKGDMPEMVHGRILGHEGIGIIEEVGSAVTTFKTGDRVHSLRFGGSSKSARAIRRLVTGGLQVYGDFDKTYDSFVQRKNTQLSFKGANQSITGALISRR